MMAELADVSARGDQIGDDFVESSVCVNGETVAADRSEFDSAMAQNSTDECLPPLELADVSSAAAMGDRIGDFVESVQCVSGETLASGFDSAMAQNSTDSCMPPCKRRHIFCLTEEETERLKKLRTEWRDRECDSTDQEETQSSGSEEDMDLSESEEETLNPRPLATRANHERTESYVTAPEATVTTSSFNCADPECTLPRLQSECVAKVEEETARLKKLRTEWHGREEDLERVSEEHLERVSEEALERVSEAVLERVSEEHLERVSEEDLERVTEAETDRVTARLESNMTEGEVQTVCAQDDYWSARRRRLQQLKTECRSNAEFELEKSREHWTQVGEPSSEVDLLHVANQQHFQRLVDQDKLRRRNYFSFLYKPRFFEKYNDDALVIGEKIGEGGQAEIFNATIHGRDDYVLKVFKPGFSLFDQERQWTVRASNGAYHSGSFYMNCCFMESGTLMKDGRFAFVMYRYWGDLRKLIDHNMLANAGLGPPFPLPEALKIMWRIAEGMVDLHARGILHRDLKASNVLVRLKEGIPDDCHIADFESSVGVHGTGFWRAPEILQALKDQASNPDTWIDIWTQKVDVYSYAMTCYEVLTARIPFGDLAPARRNYDVVIRGERPLLPPHIDSNTQELLTLCWHSDPLRRPPFHEIKDMVWRIRNKLMVER